MNTIEKIFRTKKESILVNMIKQAISQNYFVGILIKGRQQLGKTRYAFRVMNRIYDSWKSVLGHTAFPMWHFLKLLRGKKKKIILWDDAGVHASKYLSYIPEFRPLLLLLQRMLDLIGTRTNVLIVTTPSLSNLIKPLREYPDWIVVQVVQDIGFWRRAKIYKAVETVEGKKIYKFIGEDRYNLLEGFPDWFLDKYYDARDRWAKKAIDDIEAYIGQMLAEMPNISSMLSY